MYVRIIKHMYEYELMYSIRTYIFTYSYLQNILQNHHILKKMSNYEVLAAIENEMNNNSS